MNNFNEIFLCLYVNAEKNPVFVPEQKVLQNAYDKIVIKLKTLTDNANANLIQKEKCALPNHNDSRPTTNRKKKAIKKGN